MVHNSRKRFAVILAAGEGTRMKSSRPKPLVRICGEPMVAHILHAIADAKIDDVVAVVGFQSEMVKSVLVRYCSNAMRINFVEQKAQNGTGDALAAALTTLPDPLSFAGSQPPVVLVVPGDTPLLTSETIAGLLEAHEASGSAVTVGYTEAENPSGYGRVLFGKSDAVTKIVEDRDATEEERGSNRINASFYAMNIDVLAPALRRLSPRNAQGEYYLTDVVEILSKAGYKISGYELKDASEAFGVNDRFQLASVERRMRQRINASFMQRGINLVDPSSIYIDSTVEIGSDTTIWPGSFLVGQTVIGKDAEVGPEARVSNSIVGDRARVIRSDLEACYVGDDSVVGPYAVIKAGAKVPAESATGSFVVLE